MTRRADFPEPVQVQFTDEALDAVCLEDLVRASVLEYLHLEDICTSFISWELMAQRVKRLPAVQETWV